VDETRAPGHREQRYAVPTSVPHAAGRGALQRRPGRLSS
jgi:hypothetical protein